MAKFILVAGHHNFDSGALATHVIEGVEYTFKENDLCQELRDQVHIRFRHFNPDVEVVIDNDNDPLAVVINKLNKIIDEEDLLVDIHFNAFHLDTANGTEVIVKNNSSPEIMKDAGQFSLKMSEVLGTVNRGAKTESQTNRKRTGILHGKGKRFLVEVGFMSNLGDMTKYLKFKDLLVDVIVKECEILLNLNK